MAIPVFISQVRASTTDTVQVGAGSVQTLAPTRYYFYLSPKSATTDGQSLLIALEALAEASSAVTWSVALDANLKLKVVHNSGGSVNLILNRGLAWNLGFARPAGIAYPPDLSLTQTIAVPTGAGGYTAEFRSPWLWCPEMQVSDTGPDMFDPSVSQGVISAPGSASYAPDGNASFTKNGSQIEAQFIFHAVEYLYRARQPNLSYDTNLHEREDLETFWQKGLCLGHRFLFWRDKAGLPTFTNPSGGGVNTVPTFVEYFPDAATKAKPIMAPANPQDLFYWNITIGGRHPMLAATVW